MEEFEEEDFIDSTESDSLTDWSNEPSVEDLKQDYTDASSDKDFHDAKIRTWLDNLYIEGAAKPKKIDGRSAIQPKLIRKQAEWRYPTLSEPFLSTDDVFNVDPVTYEDKPAAIQNAIVLNNQINTKMNKVKFFDEVARTAANEGTVILRTGWKFLEEEQEVEVPDFQFVPSNDPQAGQQMMQLHQMMQQDPEGYKREVPPEVQQAHQMSMQSGVPIQAVPNGSHIELQMVTIANHPTVEVCDYTRITIDPSCEGDTDKAEFAVFSFETNKSELKKDSRYSNIDKIETDTTNILNEPDHQIENESSFNFTDEPRKKFVAYEYWGNWDIDGSGVVKSIVATWVGNIMIRLEENPFPDKKIPFISIQYLPVKNSIYGEPDGELLEDNQKIIGAVTRGMIDIMGRSANGQQGSRKDALDPTNKRKFNRGQDYEFNPSVDPKQAFHMHTFPEIPNSAQLMLQIQQSEAESITGVKAFHSGLDSRGLGETATGVRGVLDATSKRELGIVRRLAEGIKQVGRKFISMNAVFLSEEEVIRITNDEFITVRRDDLEGNFDLRLTISTAEADDSKAQELAFMLQTTGQTMGPEFSQLILSEIATLRKMPTLAKTIKDYQPQPDPIAQEKAQLEVELLKAQIENEYAKAAENNANAALDQAKAGNESSDTDLKNLDYVEQESGTKHARDVDIVESQANAQTRTKIVEGAIKERIEAKKSAAKTTV